MHLIVYGVTFQPSSSLQSVDDRCEVLLLDGIVGRVAVGVAAGPPGPVGAIVHLGDPDGASGALMYLLERRLPRRPVLVIVSMHGDEVAAPATRVDGVDEGIEPPGEVAGHGRRPQSLARGHHVLPVGQHLRHGTDGLALVGRVVGLVVAEDVGRGAVVAHVLDAGPSLVVMLGDILAVVPLVPPRIPVVTPGGVEQTVDVGVAAGIALLGHGVPLRQAEGGDVAVKDPGCGGQVDAAVGLVGDEHAAITLAVGTGGQRHHVSSLELEATRLVVEDIVLERVARTYRKILLLGAREVGAVIEREGLHEVAVGHDHRPVGIDADGAIVAFRGLLSIDPDKGQPRIGLAGLDTGQDDGGVLMCDVHAARGGKGCRGGGDDIVDRLGEGDGGRHLGDGLAGIGVEVAL